MVHYEQGFSVLADPPAGPAGGECSGGGGGEEEEEEGRAALLAYAFEKLRMSSDDGIRMLCLDFGGKEGEIVSVRSPLESVPGFRTLAPYSRDVYFFTTHFCNHWKRWVVQISFEYIVPVYGVFVGGCHVKAPCIVTTMY